VAPVDHELLGLLEDVWIEHSETDPREIEITFTFPENDYIKEKTLTKKFTVAKPAEGSSHESKYDLDVQLETSPVTITWKDDEHNLIKKAPRVNPVDIEDDDDLNGASRRWACFATDELEEANWFFFWLRRHWLIFQLLHRG
jgi:hypothetical protein